MKTPVPELQAPEGPGVVQRRPRNSESGPKFSKDLISQTKMMDVTRRLEGRPRL